MDKVKVLGIVMCWVETISANHKQKTKKKSKLLTLFLFYLLYQKLLFANLFLIFYKLNTLLFFPIKSYKSNHNTKK